jgi:hypothetical protein
MTAFGDYRKQVLMPMDYYPPRTREYRVYLPDLRGYEKDGVDCVIGHEEAVIALRSIQHDERFERAQRQLDQSGENI